MALSHINRCIFLNCLGLASLNGADRHIALETVEPSQIGGMKTEQ
jgi:hypothetical protein